MLLMLQQLFGTRTSAKSLMCSEPSTAHLICVICPLLYCAELGTRARSVLPFTDEVPAGVTLLLPCVLSPRGSRKHQVP